MQDLRYDRLYRTPSSESYLVSDGERPLARLELHFAQSSVYALLLLEGELRDEAVHELIAQIDEGLVWTASVPRDDFVVYVYTGRELAVVDDASRESDSRGDSGTGGDGGP